jgi:hypothetical protein
MVMVAADFRENRSNLLISLAFIRLKPGGLGAGFLREKLWTSCACNSIHALSTASTPGRPPDIP